MSKIRCEICGEATHVMEIHLRDMHPEVTLAEYQERFPDAPIMSEMARQAVEEKKRAKVAEIIPPKSAPTAHMITTQAFSDDFVEEKGALHEVFDLGKVKAAMNKTTGNPIPVRVFQPPAALADFVPDVDSNYVFPIDLLKTVLMGIEVNIPLYLWGHAGTGKSSIVEQVCARTRRPWIRVQHTRNTEESHVLGEKTVRNGEVIFELGPLAYAMKHGLLYLADEYDFAMPSVTALYQPVLEGKPLVIKEADHENRIIRPHKNFRFCATGNTNGTGDETGLYQGTLLQNAANYERFGIVEEVKYVDAKTEIALVHAQGGVLPEIAEQLVKFAQMAREAYMNQKLSLPPSPRAMINAAIVGRIRGDFEAGIRLAYANRLPQVDREAIREIMKRLSFV